MARNNVLCSGWLRFRSAGNNQPRDWLRFPRSKCFREKLSFLSRETLSIGKPRPVKKRKKKQKKTNETRRRERESPPPRYLQGVFRLI